MKGVYGRVRLLFCFFWCALSVFPCFDFLDDFDVRNELRVLSVIVRIVNAQF
jgi:hypothetical protein